MSRTSKQIRFEKALEDLVIQALDSDFSVDLIDDHQLGVVEGEFCQSSKSITVRFHVNAPIEHILFVMAHEIRHLQHYKRGIFKDYYRKEHTLALDNFSETDILPVGYTPPKPCIGVRAESDCDRWAIGYLKERGFNYVRRRYRIYDVMGYAAFIRYQTIKRERNKSSRNNKRALKGSKKTGC